MSFSSKVKELDRNRCVHCGADCRYMICDCHHIIYRSKSKKLSSDPSNGILLCRNCHSLIHEHKLNILQILEKLSKSKNFRWHKILNLLQNPSQAL